MNFSNFSFFSLIFLSFTYSSNYNLPNSCQDCGPAGNERLPTLPGLVWSRDGYDVSRDPRFSVYPNGTLIIQRTLEQDMGSYLCVANNGVSNPAQRIVMLQLRGTYTDSKVAF